MKKETRDLIKKGIRWFIYVWIFRVVSYVFYLLFLSSPIRAAVDERSGDEVRITIAFSIISIVVYALVCTLIYFRNTNDERRELVVASREPDFALFTYFKRYLPELGIYAGIYLITQLIFCGFYAAFGYVYVGSTLIEKLHVADAGFCILTRNGILGILLNTLLFIVILSAGRLVTLLLWRSDKLTRES